MTSSLGGIASSNGMPGITGMKPPSPEETFKKLDANGDGSVDKSEFAAMPKPPNADDKKMPDGMSLDKLFSEIDTNGDGIITADENDAFVKKMEEKRKAAGQSMPSYNASGESDTATTSESLFEVTA